jgi:hypothetical protein
LDVLESIFPPDWQVALIRKSSAIVPSLAENTAQLVHPELHAINSGLAFTMIAARLEMWLRS